MRDQLAVLNEFHLKIKLPIAWVDMDIYHHVNNANYFRYFEAARICYFDKIRLNEQFQKNGVAGVLSRTACHFIVPLVYPDKITSGARVIEISKDVILMEHFITSPKVGLAAFGESDIVVYNFQDSKKIDVPAWLRKAIESFEKKNLKNI